MKTYKTKFTLVTSIKYMILLPTTLFWAISSLAQCELRGLWKSDRNKTISSVYESQVLRPDAKSKISQLIGNMTVEYPDCTRAIITIGEFVTRLAIAVVSNKQGIIRVEDRESGMLTTLIMEDNCYHEWLGQQGYSEYFCRQ